MRVRTLWLAIVYVSACPSKMIDRRVDKSAKEDIQWRQSQEIAASQNVGVKSAKKSKRVIKTPLVTPTGQVVTTPSGQPVFSVEEVDESSDTSTSTETDLRSRSNTELDMERERVRLQQERETRLHNWTLRIVGVLLLLGLIGYVVLSVKRKWF